MVSLAALQLGVDCGYGYGYFLVDYEEAYTSIMINTVRGIKDKVMGPQALAHSQKM